MIRTCRIAILILLSVVAAMAQDTPRNGTISGRVTLKSGNPATGRRILALTAEQGPAARETTVMSVAVTDSQGRFLLEGVPPGPYRVAIGSLDSLTFNPGANENQAAVTVSSGGTVTGVDFRLTAVRVSGRVFGDFENLTGGGGRGGGATPRVTFARELRLGSGAGALTAAVSSNGAFQFETVKPGTYRPTVADPALGILSGDIVIDGDDIPNIQVRVGRIMSFPVTAAIEGGGTPPPFKLRFEDASAAGRPAPFIEVAAAGSFEVRLPDTQYRLVLPDAPAGLFLKSAKQVFPSGGATSILQKPFIVRQVERMEILLGRAESPRP